MRRIISNPHVISRVGIAKHAVWQLRKLTGRFPFVQTLSRSLVEAVDRDCGVSALIHSQGMYDYNNMHLVRSLADQGLTFVDIGANIGAYTLIASEAPNCRVVSVEAHPTTYGQLVRNVRLNARSNVTTLHVAFGEEPGVLRLTDGASSTNHVVGANDRQPSVAVTCVRADDCLTELAVVPTVVKLDVEGFEHAVLRGFADRLREVEALLIEMNELADQRGPGAGAIHCLLEEHELRGPYRCDFECRELRFTESGGAEDPVYLSAAGRRRLEALGFTVIDPVPGGRRSFSG